MTLPTLAAAMDSHPGIKLVTSRVKKYAKTFASQIAKKPDKCGSDCGALMQDLLLEVIKIIGSVFEFNFADLVISFFEVKAATSVDFDKMVAHLNTVPALIPHRKQLKASLQFFGSHKNASNFLVHRTDTRLFQRMGMVTASNVEVYRLM